MKRQEPRGRVLTPRAVSPELQKFVKSLEGNTNASSFYEAVKQGNLETVEAMLQRTPDLVLAKTIFKTTPLHEAAASGQTEMAKLLLANKADVHARADEGRTPLHWAAVNGHKDVAELLLANGADANAKTTGGMTPLALAKDDPAYPRLTEGRRAVAAVLRRV